MAPSIRVPTADVSYYTMVMIDELNQTQSNNYLRKNYGNKSENIVLFVSLLKRERGEKPAKLRTVCKSAFFTFKRNG